MKFFVSSSDLLNRMQAISRVIGSKAALPILENLLFSVKDSTLTITASDLEVTMVTSLALDNVDEDGTLSIPGHKLVEYLKKLPEQPITILINKETYAIEIVSAAGKNTQAGLSAEEYPENPTLMGDQTKSISMNADALICGITKTFFATGNDELRPVMNGILFDITNEHTTFVATDSHKLVRYT